VVPSREANEKKTENFQKGTQQVGGIIRVEDDKKD